MNNIKNSSTNDSSMQQEEQFSIKFDGEGEEETNCSCGESMHDEAEETTNHESIREKKHNPHLDAFMYELEKFSQAEDKVQHSLAFMENSLAQSGTPHFRSFWEVRDICLQLFKENLSPILRSQFWSKYSELSKEARRLKEILDEQSSFAAEQIEIAIAALEKDIEQFEIFVTKLESPNLSLMPKMFSGKIAFYADIQKRLNLLNVLASRINAMRKELIKTEMRVRLKNRFFQRLSQMGDKVFPLRKDLIKKLSSVFSEDVDAFIKNNFTDNFHDALFVLREEIKGLQAIAKLLTLNTTAFTHTRMRLSECWDKIKNEEKERKKERAQLKVVFKQNFDTVQQKIQELKQHYEAGELSVDLANKQIDDISKFMRQVELGRDEIKDLRDELFAIRHQVSEKIQAQEHARLQNEQERERHRKAKVEDLKNEITQLSEKISTLDGIELVAVRDELFDKVQNSHLTKYEKQEVEKLLKPLRSGITDALSDKEEQKLLSLSDDDRQAISQLKEVLKQRKIRRQEIKDALRKVSGTSGLDIEKAMSNIEWANSEKERLEKINQGIKEIEDKIAQLQKKR